MLRSISVILLLTVHIASTSDYGGDVNGLIQGRSSKKNALYKSKVMVGNEGDLDGRKESSLEAAPKEKIKIKLKKKEKKFLKEFFTAGLLVKSAILPLALGFVKLLTGKALLITMMAFGLVTVLTFSSAGEHKSSTTEIINLTGPHGHNSRSYGYFPVDNLNEPTFKQL